MVPNRNTTLFALKQSVLWNKTIKPTYFIFRIVVHTNSLILRRNQILHLITDGVCFTQPIKTIQKTLRSHAANAEQNVLLQYFVKQTTYKHYVITDNIIIKIQQTSLKSSFPC